MEKLRILLATLFLLLLPLACSSSSGGDRPGEASVGSTAQAVTTAGVHELSFNVVTTLTVQTGDILRLKGFPTDWTYSSINVNFDGAPAQMDLSVSEHGDTYGISGWSQKIVVPYRGGSTQDIVIARGSGTIRVNFWASSEPVTAPEAEAGPVIQDLSGQSVALPLQTAGGIFRIPTLPTTAFNVVSVVVQSKDGLPLDGQVNGGLNRIPLSGMAQTILFNERGAMPVVFELAFPSVRSVAITWSVLNRTPQSKAVARTATTVNGVVTAKYAFTTDHAVDDDLSLTFTAADFTDAAPPSITRFEHNPVNVRAPNLPGRVLGPTYDISANPKAGKRIQVALPLPEIVLLRGLDQATAKVMHYDAATKAWSEVTPDKIVDGYVYFTTSSFSLWDVVVDVVSSVGSAVSTAWDAGTDALVTIYKGGMTIVDGVTDTLRGLYGALVNGTCSLLEFSTYKRIFFSRTPYEAPKLDLSDGMNSPYVDVAKLQSIVGRAGSPGVPASGNDLVALTAPAGLNNAQIELAQWKTSLANAELLMADVLLAARPNYTRRFEARRITALRNVPANLFLFWPDAYNIHDTHGDRLYPAGSLFRFSSTLLTAAPRVAKLVLECGNAAGLGDELSSTIGHIVDSVREFAKGDLGDSCRNALMLPKDAVDWVTPDLLTCLSELNSFQDYSSTKNLPQYYQAERDSHVLDASAFLNQFSVLMWADPAFRDVWGNGVDTLRDEMRSFVGLAHEAYGDGNIPIKAMAGVALWDMISRNDAGNFNTLKDWLEAKSGDAGGYAEGTGYLQYINADVPYLFAAMMRGGMIKRDALPRKYLQSAEWLMNASPLPLVRPAESDDGITYQQDFRLYSFLTGKARYNTLDPRVPNSDPRAPVRLVSPVSPVMLPLGLTTKALKGSAAVLPDVSFADGIGMVRVNGGTNPSAALSIIAESGNMRVNGNAHDQQDNGSITLTRLAGSVATEVIVDPGYNGFDKRTVNPCLSPSTLPCLEPRFDAHNVVMTVDPADFRGEARNGPLTFGDVTTALSHLPNVHNIDFGNAIAKRLVYAYTTLRDIPESTWSNSTESTPVGDIDAHAGGADADLLGPLVNDVRVGSIPGSPLLGFAAHGLEVKHTSTAGVTNRRFVASFAQHLWILDRPDAKRPLWSRLHWSSAGSASAPYANAVQIPEADAAQDIDISWPEKDPTGSETVQPYHRAVRRRTQVDGSALAPAAFLTGVPVAEGAALTFTKVDCTGAVCAHSGTAATSEDVVIVPKWGQQYQDCGLFFQGLVTTGQIVLAHRDAGSQTWILRLLGDEPPQLAATSMAGQASRQPDVLYKVAPGGSLQVVLPNGTTTALHPLPDGSSSTCSPVPACTQPTADAWTSALGAAGNNWQLAFGNPASEPSNNRLRLSYDDIVQRSQPYSGGFYVTYQVTLEGGTVFTPSPGLDGVVLPSMRRAQTGGIQFGGDAYGGQWSDSLPAGFAGRSSAAVLSAKVTTFVKAQARQVAMKVEVDGKVYRSGWIAGTAGSQTDVGRLQLIGQNNSSVFSGSTDYVYVGPLSGCSAFSDAEIDALYGACPAGSACVQAAGPAGAGSSVQVGFIATFQIPGQGTSGTLVSCSESNDWSKMTTGCGVAVTATSPVQVLCTPAYPHILKRIDLSYVDGTRVSRSCGGQPSCNDWWSPGIPLRTGVTATCVFE